MEPEHSAWKMNGLLCELDAVVKQRECTHRVICSPKDLENAIRHYMRYAQIVRKLIPFNCV